MGENQISGSAHSTASSIAAILQNVLTTTTTTSSNLVAGGIGTAESDGTEAPPDPFVKLRRQCYERLNKTATNYVAGKLCPGTFDGWLCWPDTAAGTSAYEPCPDFIIGFDPLRYAHKECDEDGEWFKHPLTNKTWSNYTTCVNLDDLEWKHSINLISEVGYCISLIAILLSLAILGYFK
ncbi:calcitonin gene-related peptide type 1 receptor-like [Teleopsis dalmanni]|nr:calcitonin gene-related peptide type 1 receptor-like [Teleopsis dalmanni]